MAPRPRTAKLDNNKSTATKGKGKTAKERQKKEQEEKLGRAAVAEKPRGDLIDGLITDWRRERSDLDPSAMAVVGRVLRVGTTLNSRINDVLKPHGLLYSEFDALATLLRSGKPYELTPTELQDAVVLTSGAMTALLNRLTKQGLIARRRSKVDGRSLTARLTAKGVKLTNKLVALRFDEARDAVAGLSKTQQKDLALLLRAFGESLER